MQEVREAAYQTSTASRAQHRAELEGRASACKADAADAARQVQEVEADMAQLQRRKLELVEQLKQVRWMIEPGRIQVLTVWFDVHQLCTCMFPSVHAQAHKHMLDRLFRGRTHSARWWPLRPKATPTHTTCCRLRFTRHSWQRLDRSWRNPNPLSSNTTMTTYV